MAKPAVTWITALALCIAHHGLDAWADGQEISSTKPDIPQVWINRFGTALAFSVQTSLSITMSFVLTQLLWYSVKRHYFTMRDIDTLYLVERRNVLALVLSKAIYNGPLLALACLLALMLPIPVVFTPGALRVATQVGQERPLQCNIPSGNLTNVTASSVLFRDTGVGYWSGVPAVATQLATQVLVGQAIPLLPRPCGTNCTYYVPMDSMAFRCISDAPVPGNLSITTTTSNTRTYWSAVPSEGYASYLALDPTIPFYVVWGSTGTDGTNGTTFCEPLQAHYVFQVTILNGIQTVQYNVTYGDPILPVTTPDDFIALSTSHDPAAKRAYQVASIAYITRATLLGQITANYDLYGIDWNVTTQVTSAAFVNTQRDEGYSDDSWVFGDVVAGIEQLSHNISAALLNLNFGYVASECSLDLSLVVYQYDPKDLWLPYGASATNRSSSLFIDYPSVVLQMSLLVVGAALAAGFVIMLSLNTEDRTTSFSDTIEITRNPAIDMLLESGYLKDNVSRSLPRIRFRLGRGGFSAFGTLEDLNFKDQ